MPCFVHIRQPLLGSEWLPGHLVIGAKTLEMIAIVYFQKLKYLQNQVTEKTPKQTQISKKPPN